MFAKQSVGTFNLAPPISKTWLHHYKLLSYIYVMHMVPAH